MLNALEVVPSKMTTEITEMLQDHYTYFLQEKYSVRQGSIQLYCSSADLSISVEQLESGFDVPAGSCASVPSESGLFTLKYPLDKAKVLVGQGLKSICGVQIGIVPVCRFLFLGPLAPGKYGQEVIDELSKKVLFVSYCAQQSFR